MEKLTQKKKVSISTVIRMVKKGRKSLRRSRKPKLSAAIVQMHLERSARLLNNLKNHQKRILIFSNKKTFTVSPIINKQNDLVVTFRNNVSEHRRVSTTKQQSMSHDAR